MKKIFATLLLLTISLNSFAQIVWATDPDHSKLTFSVTHLGISNIDGLFNTFEATISSSKADFSDAVLEMTADVNSINTQVEARDNHLRSADFFDVEKFPKMYYKSTSIRKDGKEKGRYVSNGYLTMHGVVKPVELKLWYRGTMENPSNKKTAAGFQVTGSLQRSDFQLGEKFPESIISNEVMLKADVEFLKKQ